MAQQPTPHQAEILKILGNMDLDSDPTEIAEGYYRYAKNIVQTRGAVGTSRSTKATLGNEYIIDIGSITQQNKRYRVYFPAGADFDMVMSIRLSDGGPIGLTWTFTQTALAGNAMAIAWKAATDAYFNGLPTETIVTILGQGFVDFEYGTIPMLEYDFNVVDANGTSPYDAVCIKESISADLAGNLIPIQSFDLNGKLFLWSTTQQFEKTELDATVTTIGPVSGTTYNGPLTQINFGSAHGLIAGQRIQITDCPLYWCNGTFIIVSITATSISIATELFWGGTLTGTGTLSDTTIYIHPEAAGEIGVVEYEKNLDTYSYKRLIRSKDIELRTLWTLDRPHVELNNYRTSFYWTDGETNPKAMYYLNDLVVDGFLGHTNGDNLYWFGHLADAISHITRATDVLIDLTGQDQDGGNLIACTYRYTARLLNKFLVPSQWSLPTAPVTVYAPSSIVGDYGNKVIGSDPGVRTGKINILSIDRIDRFAYDFIEIGIIMYTGDVPAAAIISRLPLKGAGIGQELHPPLEYKHDGYEIPSALPLSDIPDISNELFDTARNGSVLDNRMVFSDLSKADEVDLTAWAKTFNHRIMTAFMSEAYRPNTTPDNLNTIGEYQDIQNVFRYVGYMDNDIYRQSVMLRDRKTKKWTKVFWVDDVQMDAFSTNGGNPTDNRRVPSAATSNINPSSPQPIFGAQKADWALTSNPASPITAPVPVDPQDLSCRVHVTYLEFFGADMTALIGGIPIRQRFDKIRFVRPDTVASVLSTGMAVQSVSHPANVMLYGPDSQMPAIRLISQIGTIYSPERFKTCIYGENNKTVHEYPYFVGGMIVPDDPLLPEVDIPGGNLTLPFPNPPISKYLEFDYPNPAFVGQGFGSTMIRPNGCFDAIREFTNQDWEIDMNNGDDNNWSHGPNRTAFIAYPNILTLYCPDALFGKIDGEELNQGRYKLRVMAINHEVIRTKVNSPTAWGRAFNQYSEFHPYPATLARTWRDLDIKFSATLPHAGSVDPEPFFHTEAIVNDAQSGIVNTQKYFDKTYWRNLAAINLKKYTGFQTDDYPYTDTSMWQNQPYITEEIEGEDREVYNPSPLFLWNNCPAIMLQMGHNTNDGDSPDNPADFPYLIYPHSQRGSDYGVSNGNMWWQNTSTGELFLNPSPPLTGTWQQYIEVGDDNGSSDLLLDHTDLTNDQRGALYAAKKVKPTSIGMCYVQLVRSIDDPYGNPEETIYREVTAEFDISLDDTVVPVSQFPIFGGDTFTQGTYIKNRYMNEQVRTDTTAGWDLGFDRSQLGDGEGFAARPGFGSAFKMYSQNRVNSQMRHSGGTQQIFLGDTTDETAWIEETDRKKDEFTYSSAYTPEFQIQAFSAFVVSFLKRGTFPARFHWSERAIVDALSDRYRFVPVLNFKDINLTEGNITWHKGLNGELVSWQRNAFVRQFFNAAGQLQVAEGQINVNIGDGGVMNRDGIQLSMFGTSKREGIIYGRSNGGKDVAFWFNAVEFQFCRFGADGLVVISERQPIYSWIRANAQWVIDEEAPYEMYGIRGVWDKAYSEAIWTFTGRRRAAEWETGRGIPQGTVRFSTNATPANFHQLPDLYRALSNHTSAPDNEPGIGTDWQTYWEVIPHTDPNHYTEFSIAWNEVKNGFSCFYTPMPRIYLPWNDTFITTHPTTKSSLFVHRQGETLKWWELNGTELTDIAFVEVVHNTVPDDTKRYVAIQAASDTAPDRLEFETYNQESYLDDTEFTGVNDPTSSHTWRSPVKGDSSVTGVNTGNVMMRGEYMIIKLIFNALSPNAVRSFILKYYGRGRQSKN